MLPLCSFAVGRLAAGLASWTLLISAVGAQSTDVIEYYNAGHDHYFITALPLEISALDAGQFIGWTRTGLNFRAYSQPFGSASPVCRFYIPPGYGDSHFYSASPAECAIAQSKYPFFDYESPNVMYVDLPDSTTGACPSGEFSVYRMWDARADTNHRYTTSLAVRAQMVAKGWVAEGYGPNQVIMCAPPATKIGRYRVGTRGMWAVFDRRGYPNGYPNGQVIQEFGQFDQQLQDYLSSTQPGVAASPTIGAEVALQLDHMRDMGVNAITFEIRSTEPDNSGSLLPYVPPRCPTPRGLGVTWPQPDSNDLAGLRALMDAANTRGIRMILSLTNMHMDAAVATQSDQWLSAILGAVKDHPALDLILFNGNTFLIDTNGDGAPDACGMQAEAPLWNGPGDQIAQSVKRSIALGLAMGIPAKKLSAEAIVGSFVDTQPPNKYATDGHQWPPILTLKMIFDQLGIPNAQRTYALSFYEHNRCAIYPASEPCVDVAPHAYAEQTIQFVLDIVGSGNGARIVAAEMGAHPANSSTWTSAQALESLTSLMEKYQLDGGANDRWVSVDQQSERDPTLVGHPVKLRGVAFNYNPVQKEVVDLGGFHLTAIPNGSFETGGTTADNWVTSGAGSVTRFRLADEPGQPAVPTRGDYALRLVTGSGTNDSVSATSAAIKVSPGTTYTTTGNLRFQWSGDPLVGIPGPNRPQVYFTVHYLIADGVPSAVLSQDTFRYFQEDAPTGFGTFPVVYSTPADTNLIQVEIGAARNGLAQPITLTADNMR